MKKTILTLVIIGVIALVIGFFGGTMYQKNKIPTRQAENFQMGANGARPVVAGANKAAGINNRGGAPVGGKIISMDDTSITVQGTDGSNKIILLSEQTKINKTSDGAKSDLVIGAEVMVIGNTTNGAITAQSISLGTNFMRSQTAPTPSTTAK